MQIHSARPSSVRAADPVADLPARLGAPLDAPRHLWWNFVASQPARIGQAAADWTAQAMGHVAGDSEFIPLPDRPLPGAYTVPV